MLYFDWLNRATVGTNAPDPASVLAGSVWVSDGTAEGTVPMFGVDAISYRDDAEPCRLTWRSSPSRLFVYRDCESFYVPDEILDRLWVVKAKVWANTLGAAVDARNLTVSDRRLFFNMASRWHGRERGRELWVASIADSRIVRDIRPEGRLAVIDVAPQPLPSQVPPAGNEIAVCLPAW